MSEGEKLIQRQRLDEIEELSAQLGPRKVKAIYAAVCEGMIAPHPSLAKFMRRSRPSRETPSPEHSPDSSEKK